MRQRLLIAATIALLATPLISKAETTEAAPEAAALVERANERLNAQDQVEARRLMEQAASSGDPEAINALAGYVEMGVGGQPDPTLAEQLFEQALAAGSEGAALNFGRRLIAPERTEADHARGVVLLTRAYQDRGFRRIAAGGLGVAYLFGWGVQQDIRKGMDLLEEADADFSPDDEESGSHDGGVLYLLGRGYDQGWGGRRAHPRRAYGYFVRAAEHDNPRAAWLAGMMLLNGDGVAKDEMAAYEWVRKAAEAGDRNGQASLGVMLALGQGVKENDPEARAWYEKASQQGSPNAMKGLGFMLMTGEGGPVDKPRARALIELAAEADDPNAKLMLEMPEFGVEPKDRPSVDRMKAEWISSYGRPTPD